MLNNFKDISTDLNNKILEDLEVCNNNIDNIKLRQVNIKNIIIFVQNNENFKFKRIVTYKNKHNINRSNKFKKSLKRKPQQFLSRGNRIFIRPTSTNTKTEMILLNNINKSPMNGLESNGTINNSLGDIYSTDMIGINSSSPCFNFSACPIITPYYLRSSPVSTPNNIVSTTEQNNEELNYGSMFDVLTDSNSLSFFNSFSNTTQTISSS